MSPLNVRLPLRLEIYAKNKPISDRARKWCEEVAHGPPGDKTKLKDVIENLKGQGYSYFNATTMAWEEPDYGLDDWVELSNFLVEQGLPEKCAQTLKLATEARQASSQCLLRDDFRGGERVTHYTKLQVIPGALGEVDTPIAVYRLTANMLQGIETGISAKDSFTGYVELDDHGVGKETNQFVRE